MGVERSGTAPQAGLTPFLNIQMDILEYLKLESLSLIFNVCIIAMLS